MNSPISWHRDADGVVTLMLDDPNQPVNTMNTEFMQALFGTIDQLEAQRDSVTGVIICSGKPSFLAGGDLKRLVAIDSDTLPQYLSDLRTRKSYLRRLADYGKPVVALLTGPALGGGLELALCCSRRIAVNNGRTQVGLPEVTLGLLPGAGGIVRTVRLLGLQIALEQVLLTGRKYHPYTAAEIGLVDEVLDSDDAAHAAARRWIQQAPEPRTPSNTRPGSGSPTWPTPIAKAHPGKERIVDVAVFAASGDPEEAFERETAAFAELLVNERTKNTIRVNFFDTATLRRRTKSNGPRDMTATPLFVTHNDRGRRKIKDGGWDLIVDVVNSSASTTGKVVGLHISPPIGIEPAIWLSDDHVGDGQRVLEYVDADEPAVAAAISTLSASGVLAISIPIGGESFAAVIRAAFADAIDSALGGGATFDDIRAAFSWADIADSMTVLKSASGSYGHAVTERRFDPVELAIRILDDVATVGMAAVEDGALKYAADADVASVRVGGFPAWTGGIRRWIDLKQCRGLS